MSDERSPDPFASSDVGSDSPARGGQTVSAVFDEDDIATFADLSERSCLNLWRAKIVDQE